MAKYSAGVVALVLFVCIGLATPSYAQASGMFVSHSQRLA
jgi:hypothetical protein